MKLSLETVLVQSGDAAPLTEEAIVVRRPVAEECLDGSRSPVAQQTRVVLADRRGHAGDVVTPGIARDQEVVALQHQEEIVERRRELHVRIQEDRALERRVGQGQDLVGVMALRILKDAHRDPGQELRCEIGGSPW